MHELPSYVVLIDDDEDDLEMLSAELELKGVKVKTFLSSAKALFYLTLMSGNKELPTLIIMDYNMPKENGQQILLSIKSNDDMKRIPVIMYSTNMSGTLEKELSGAGAFACFIKPCTYSDIIKQAEKFKELTHSFTANKNLA